MYIYIRVFLTHIRKKIMIYVSPSKSVCIHVKMNYIYVRATIAIMITINETLLPLIGSCDYLNEKK
jgi:hypothetical protein